ncbi:hypothetical protein DPMN_111020 [Dreissena polymorpha]|uniref:Uncharacterized protein n=1 Tax=Dreissena polymorpha TaxID=45954 RepID=A0A9D4KD29_DREPO|nr:hypothetical protein DPMN_111020 [Dreissena polymorpha]
MSTQNLSKASSERLLVNVSMSLKRPSDDVTWVETKEEVEALHLGHAYYPGTDLRVVVNKSNQLDWNERCSGFFFLNVCLEIFRLIRTTHFEH